MSKQYLARNITWNKHFRLLPDQTLNTLGTQLLTSLQQDHRIRYCLFTIEQGKKQQGTNSFHFQGYLEFNRPVDINAFK